MAVILVSCCEGIIQIDGILNTVIWNSESFDKKTLQSSICPTRRRENYLQIYKINA
jgi:hypothetical protein